MAVRGLKRPNSVGGNFPLFPKVIHIPLKLALEYIIKKLSRNYQERMVKNMVRDRISRDQMFSQICSVVAQRSTCLRSQVGALIVREGRIVSMGYNGPVSGMPACSKPDDLQQVLIIAGALEPSGTECMGPACTRSLHAETNAIAFAARAGVSVEGCTMYCSMSPCINCAKVIVNSGIKELKYLEEYRDTSGLELLRKAGITVEQVLAKSIQGEQK